MNPIPQLQNDKKQLERLAAARQLYSKAKIGLLWQLTLVIGAATLLAMLLAAYPEVGAWAAILVAIIIFVDMFVLDPRRRDFVQQAAKMQDAFDSDVLGLQWPSIKMDAPPDPEVVRVYSLKYQMVDPSLSKLRNLYVASLGQVPLAVARIICQRANVWWDSEILGRYDRYIYAIVGLAFIIILTVGCFTGSTFVGVFVATLVSILPALQWGIREYLKLQEAVENLSRLLRLSATLFDRACKKLVTDDQLTQAARALQSEIYDQRCTAPLIFGWIHNLIRRETGDSMMHIGDLLVKEYLGKIERA